MWSSIELAMIFAVLTSPPCSNYAKFSIFGQVTLPCLCALYMQFPLSKLLFLASFTWKASIHFLRLNQNINFSGNPLVIIPGLLVRVLQRDKTNRILFIHSFVLGIGSLDYRDQDYARWRTPPKCLKKRWVGVPAQAERANSPFLWLLFYSSAQQIR